MSSKSKLATTSLAIAPVMVSQVSPGKRLRRQRQRARRRARNNPSTSLVPVSGNNYRGQIRPKGAQLGRGLKAAQSYIDCLNNPFDFAPVPLGLGTMIPTTCVSTWVRGGYFTNADGSFQLVLNPTQYAFNSSANGAYVSLNNSAAAVAPTFTSVTTSTNATQIAAEFDQLRVVAGGIRVFPSIAGTSPPGCMVAGVVAPASSGNVPGTSSVAAWTNSTVTNFPSLDTFYGYDPVQVNWRPAELSDFDFSTSKTAATRTTDDTNLPVCVIASTSFPASTAIYFEAITHYEGYASTVLSGFNVTTLADNAPDSGISSIESLWQTAKKYIGPAAEKVADYALRNGLRYLNSGFPRSRMIEQTKTLHFRGSLRALDIEENKEDLESKEHFSSASSSASTPILIRPPRRP